MQRKKRGVALIALDDVSPNTPVHIRNNFGGEGAFGTHIYIGNGSFDLFTALKIDCS